MLQKICGSAMLRRIWECWVMRRVPGAAMLGKILRGGSIERDLEGQRC